MTTINLRDGLEALYYFGEQDFYPQRNLLQDHSGYGRHASAKGGITIPSDDGSGNEVGANGPNDFSATSLDGSDDYFDVTSDISVLGQEFTAFAIHDFLGFIFDSDNANGGYGITHESFRVRDDNGNVNDATVNNATNVIVGRFDNGTLMADNGEEKAVRKVGVTASQTVENAVIGVNNNLNFTSSGKISAYACWSRALSDAEVEYLTRLTAPRRAML